VADLECLTADELAGDAEWWRIYDQSFPAHEREPAEIILKSVRGSAGMAFRAQENGATVGIATTHLLSNPAAVFLVYLAIDSKQRSRGGGAALFEFAWSESSRRLRANGAEPLGMIWEMDEQSGEHERRIRFFERHGGTLIRRPYLQPPVNGPHAVPMRLMFRSADGAPIIDTTLDSLVRGIYFDKYGAVNGIPAPLLERLLRNEDAQ
jgi:hypothetical protein